MTWEKKNLVTLSDMSDIFRCSDCGFEKKYYGLERTSKCPKCAEKEDPIVGWWGVAGRISSCPSCQATGIIVPKKEHELSSNWKYERPNEQLICCPNECREKSGKKKKFKRGN
jgi:hypothetical protein